MHDWNSFVGITDYCLEYTISILNKIIIFNIFAILQMYLADCKKHFLNDIPWCRNFQRYNILYASLIQESWGYKARSQIISWGQEGPSNSIFSSFFPQLLVPNNAILPTGWTILFVPLIRFSWAIFHQKLATQQMKWINLITKGKMQYSKTFW